MKTEFFKIIINLVAHSISGLCLKTDAESHPQCGLVLWQLASHQRGRKVEGDLLLVYIVLSHYAFQFLFAVASDNIAYGKHIHSQTSDN
jgi:hypothetical protein